MSNWEQDYPPEELENGCIYCGEPSKGIYCNKDCKKAYEAEN